jgi:hypothetical protein
MTYEDIVNNTNATRSDMVKSALDDFRKGDAYPLGLLHEPEINTQ